MAKAGQLIDLGASGVKITITKTASDTNGEVAQMESMMQPAKRLPTLAHIHPSQEERIEVISGKLTTLLNGNSKLLSAGESILIPRGELHNFWNASDDVVHFRVEHRPALNIHDFIETIGGLVKDGLIRYDNSFSDKLQMAVVVNRFKATMILPMPQRLVIKIIGTIGELLGKGKNLSKYIS